MATENEYPNGVNTEANWNSTSGVHWSCVDDWWNDADYMYGYIDGAYVTLDFVNPTLGNNSGCCYQIVVHLRAKRDGDTARIAVSIWDGAAQLGSTQYTGYLGGTFGNYSLTWTGLSKIAADLTDFRVKYEVDFLSGGGSHPADDVNISATYAEFTYLLPAISRTPTTLTPSCVAGNNATPDTFEVWQSAGGCARLDYSITDDVAWLSCAPSSGDSTGEHDTITVTYATSGLGAGSYGATITIADADASNTPQTIAVTLTVTAASAIGEVDDVARASIGEVNDVALVNIGAINEVT